MKKVSIFLILLVAPLLTSAATVSAPRDFKGFVAIITDIIGTLVIVVFALTFLAFMWGVIKTWILHGDDPESIESGKKVLFTAIIALVIMISIWGILSMLQASLFR